MNPMTLSQISKAVGSYIGYDGTVTCIVSDSREVVPGALFVAFNGERVNGHDYIQMALDKGAVAAIAEQDGNFDKSKVMMVASSLRALQNIAACYRKQFHPLVIAITGSVGKTTTKEMVAATLEPFFNTLKTQGNQNNEIGLPRTILNLREEHELAVVEMGMSAMGEINDLCRCALPRIGVITNIGVSHMERLGNRENILRAKLELAANLPDGADLFLCNDSEYLPDVTCDRLHIIRYGLNGENLDIRGNILRETPKETTFTIEGFGKTYEASIPGFGEHLVRNALAAFGVAVRLGVEPEKAIEALKHYEPSGMRQKVVEVKDFLVVEDCYNASPDSMKAAIRALSTYPCSSRRIFVAADMLELGTISKQAHYDVGKTMAECGIDYLLCYGSEAKYIRQGAEENGLKNACWYADKQELARALNMIKPGDILWFKGSRGMQLEDVIQKIYEQYRDEAK